MIFIRPADFTKKLRQEQLLNVEICFVMGLWYRQMQQFGQAADAFVQGLILKPDSSDLYYELANTMREMGSDEGAERYYRHCLALRPNYLDGMFCLGQVLAAQEKNNEAAAWFCQALGAGCHHAGDDCHCSRNVGVGFGGSGHPYLFSGPFAGAR